MEPSTISRRDASLAGLKAEMPAKDFASGLLERICDRDAAAPKGG